MIYFPLPAENKKPFSPSCTLPEAKAYIILDKHTHAHTILTALLIFCLHMQKCVSATRYPKEKKLKTQKRQEDYDYVFIAIVSVEGPHYAGGGTNLLSQSSSLDPPPDDVGEGLSDGDVTDDVTLRNTNTSRPLSFRQTLPTAS